jgi:hypothetical protein
MTGCYLTSLPFEFMRSTADFDPDWAGSYFLPRDTVKPSTALCRRIWPALDQWKEAHDSASSTVEANKAAGAFLELLAWLRVVLLQDAVFLQKHYPQHPIFQDPAFHSREFAAFALQIEDACRTAEEDTYVATIDRAIPAVAEKLRALSSQQTASNLWTERAFVELTNQVKELSKKVEDLSKVSYTISISPGRSTISQQIEMPKRGRPTAASRMTMPAQEPSRAAAAPPASSTAVKEQDTVVQPSTASRPALPASVKPQVPKFEFPLDIKTVSDLWHLWKQGRAGMPSIESLEATWGSTWRPKSQKSVFCGRKAIVDFISRKLHELGGETNVAEHSRVIQRIEQLCPEWSLDKVTKAIKNGDIERKWLSVA